MRQTNPMGNQHAVAANIPTSFPDVLFADGFETGNYSAWSSSTTGNGDLNVSAASALIGNNGMEALINDNNAIFITNENPNGENRYRGHF
jgi:hypothetical protein